MLGESLEGKRFGVVGPGRIGRETARLAEAFGATALYAGRSDPLEALLGDRSRIVLEGLLRFEQAHPHDEPHYYLSFVATHDDHRGRGIAEQLLAQNLARIDAEHLPAYLESSNPKNLERYGRLGFAPIGEFSMPDGGPIITTMWRAARRA